ncbi:MAG TPA: hypothetical protein VK536_04745 [Candidatus Limnocylindrales bacterium]|nr:hypothetical protein [Candidatus Limnocylindrales bacterium]
MNLFSVFPTRPVSTSFSGFFQALQKAGDIPLYHALEGLLLIAFSLIILALSIKIRIKSVQVSSILALTAVVSAATGGIPFVFSGFTDNG